MRKKGIFILSISLIASLILSFYLFCELRSVSSKQNERFQDLVVKLTQSGETITELNEYIESHSTETTQRIDNEKVVIKQFLNSFYTLSKDTKESRLKNIESITTDSVYKELNPTPDQKVKTDQPEPDVTISAIELFSNNENRYLAKFVLTYDLSENQKNTQTCVALLEIEDGKVSYFEQPIV